MSTFETSPIYKIIETIKSNNTSEQYASALQNELMKTNESNEQVYRLGIKENDGLLMVYYNELPEQMVENTKYELENSCKSIIFDAKTLSPIGSQFNKIIYNTEATDLLNNTDWSNIVVQTCYEGTMILVYHFNDKWYISTRRCIDASSSIWVRGMSYSTMFMDTIEGKFKLEDLDTNYCYHFVLVHNMNKNIVSYPEFPENYKEIFHVLTTEKHTLNEVKYRINDNVKYIKEESFASFMDMQNALSAINTDNTTTKVITCEGYVLRVYQNSEHTGPFKILKFQTDIYQELMKIKPNNSNIHQSFLELYQKDKLIKYLPYFSNNGKAVVNRIHSSLFTIATEVLNIYHATRSKKNTSLYEILPKQYKHVLYKLHGMYIANKVDGKAEYINVHVVRKLLKELDPKDLRQLYYDRTLLEQNGCGYVTPKSTEVLQMVYLMFHGIGK